MSRSSTRRPAHRAERPPLERLEAATISSAIDRGRSGRSRRARGRPPRWRRAGRAAVGGAAVIRWSRVNDVRPRRPSRLSTTSALAEAGRAAEGDPDLGRISDSSAPWATSRERLAGRRLPVVDPGRLAEREEPRVVGVAHRVGVAEPDRDLEPVREVAREVARVVGHVDPAGGRGGWGRRADRSRAASLPAGVAPGGDDRNQASLRMRPRSALTKRPTDARRSGPSTLTSPGRSSTNRTVSVSPGRAMASTLGMPSTIQSWITGSSLRNARTVHWPAVTVQRSGHETARRAPRPRSAAGSR